jgi:single-strand DNA-binding protein
MSVNKVILVGNVGKDPEIRYLEGGTAVCSFPLATSATYRNRDGERITSTEWHNIVLWRGLAEIAERYVKKGSQLFIEGRIRTRSWDDREGNKRYTTEIIADNMQMLGRRPDDTSDTQAPSGESQADEKVEEAPDKVEEAPENEEYTDTDAGTSPGEDDDLPF